MGKRSGIQLALPLEERLLVKRYRAYDGYLIITQPKLDGERCRAVWTGSEYKLLSSEENEFIATPHINMMLNGLPESYRGMEFDGELYIHGKSREHVRSIVSRTRDLHPDFLDMQYHMFDLADESASQLKRLFTLKGVFLNLTPQQRVVLRKVNVEIVHNLADMWKMYEGYLVQGYEGIIVRHPDAPYKRGRDWRMLKFKPSKSDTYLVIGYKEEISIDGVPKGRLGALICQDRYGNQFSVGSGLDHAKREKYWAEREELAGKWVKINYQRLSVHGIPLEIVFNELLDHASWD